MFSSNRLSTNNKESYLLIGNNTNSESRNYVRQLLGMPNTINATGVGVKKIIEGDKTLEFLDVALLKVKDKAQSKENNQLNGSTHWHLKDKANKATIIIFADDVPELGTIHDILLPYLQKHHRICVVKHKVESFTTDDLFMLEAAERFDVQPISLIEMTKANFLQAIREQSAVYSPKQKLTNDTLNSTHLVKDVMNEIHDFLAQSSPQVTETLRLNVPTVRVN